MLAVATGRLPNPRAKIAGYTGPDALNVTRGSGGAAGAPFAPSPALLAEGLRRKRAAKKDSAALVTAWQWYAPQYVEEMRASWRDHRAAWGALLARRRVVLCCYCGRPQFCHRTLLAELLVAAGRRYGVEVVLEGEVGARAAASAEGGA